MAIVSLDICSVKNSELSHRICVCENSSAVVLSVTDSLIVLFDSTHKFCKECWVKSPLPHQGVKP